MPPGTAGESVHAAATGVTTGRGRDSVRIILIPTRTIRPSDEILRHRGDTVAVGVDQPDPGPTVQDVIGG